MATVTIDELDEAAEPDFVAATAVLFEGAPRFLGRLAAARPFGSFEALFRRARATARSMPEDEQIELVDAHPRLGAPPGSVSPASFREQGYDRDAADAAAEAERMRVDAELARLNEAYETRFGFRYCTFVAGRPRAALLLEFRAALAADREAELRRAVDAVLDIARDRARRIWQVDGRAGVIELGENRYGKSAIRLVKLVRDGSRHTVRDLTVAIALEGDFRAAHVDGDNSLVVATDTMKNTVYALAREYLSGAVESFGQVLARHFLAFPQVGRATVSLDEHRWVRLPTEDGPADDAFLRSGDFTRTAVVSAAADRETVEAGIRDLTLMKTTRSAFAGFPRDPYTTLPETDERIMATLLTASWRYGAATEFDSAFDRVGATLLDVFAAHDSASVQHSIWLLGRAVLDRHPEIESIRMVLPNLHHWLVDLSPFGQANEREVYVATREPYGLIEATVRRTP